MADKKMELIVNVNVTKTGSPVTATSVNTVGIIVADKVVSDKSEHANKQYSDSDEVKGIFGSSSEAYKMAQKFFAQKNHPSVIYVVTVSEKTAENIGAAISEASLSDVYHWVVNLGSVDSETEATIKELNVKAAEDYKIFHVELDVSSSSDRETLATIFNGATGLSVSATKRVAVYAHATEGDHIGVSIAADRCGVDPARGTWAHKALEGNTPDSLTKGELKEAMDNGYNVFTSIAGNPRIFMGTTCGPKTFVDTIVKSDLIKFRLQEAIYDALQKGGDGYGLDMSDDGIASLGAVVNGIMNAAVSNHYIMDGYSVKLPLYADISSEDKAKRNLSGIKATLTLMDSIHTVVSVNIGVEN